MTNFACEGETDMTKEALLQSSKCREKIMIVVPETARIVAASSAVVFVNCLPTVATPFGCNVYLTWERR